MTKNQELNVRIWYEWYGGRKMNIKTENDFIEAQEKLSNLKLVLVEAKKHARTAEEYTKLSESLLWGIKNLETEIYKFLSKY